MFGDDFERPGLGVEPVQQLEHTYVSGSHEVPDRVEAAQNSLYEACRGETLPCTTRKFLFDDRLTMWDDKVEPAKSWKERAIAASRICLTECAFLRQCGKLVDSLNPDHPEIVGVLAGRLVPSEVNSVSARIMAALEYESGE